LDLLNRVPFSYGGALDAPQLAARVRRRRFTHASCILRWRLIEDRSALKSWRKYFRRLEDGRPNAYKIGLDTVAIIDEVGLDTIEQQKIIVNKLIDKYKLREILSIDDSANKV